MQVALKDVVRDEGSIVVLLGETCDGSARDIRFAVDHRMAKALIDALESDDLILAEIETWQIVGA